MKKLKQVVSLLLVAVMCLGLLPAMAAPAGAGTITVKTTDTVTGQPLSNVTYKLENITAGRQHPVEMVKPHSTPLMLVGIALLKFLCRKVTF